MAVFESCDPAGVAGSQPAPVRLSPVAGYSR